MASASKIALVTGAGSGIGKAAALALLDGSALLRAALGSAVVDCLVAIRQYELATYGDRPQADRIALLAPRY